MNKLIKLAMSLIIALGLAGAVLVNFQILMFIIPMVYIIRKFYLSKKENP